MASVHPRLVSAPSLTLRQREVLALVATGEPDKAIASRLGISERAIRFHLAESRARLGAKSRSHLVAVALTTGLLGGERDHSRDRPVPPMPDSTVARVVWKQDEVADLVDLPLPGPALYLRHAHRSALICTSSADGAAARDAVDDVCVSVPSHVPASIAEAQRALADGLRAYLRAHVVHHAIVDADLPMLLAEALRAAEVRLEINESNAEEGSHAIHPSA